MLEWLKRHVWKACDRPKRFQGSNPCLSAQYNPQDRCRAVRCDITVQQLPMHQKSFLHLFCAALLALGACAPKAPEKGALIEGLATGLDPEHQIVAILFHYDGNVGQGLQSDTLQDGHFSFRLDSLSGENYYGISLMRFEGDRMVNVVNDGPEIYLEPGAYVRIQGEGKYFKNARISSPVKDQQLREQFIRKMSLEDWKAQQDVSARRDEIVRMTYDQGVSPEQRDSLRKLSKELLDEWNKINDRLSQQKLKLLETEEIGSYALHQLNAQAAHVAHGKPENREAVLDLYERLSDEQKTSPDGMEILNYVNPVKTLGVGDSLPPYDYIDKNGKTVRLEEFRGRWVLLDFWSYGCGPCIQAIPELGAVSKEFQDRLAVVSISLDRESSWKEASAEHGIFWNDWNDPQGSSGSVRVFGTTGIPTFVLVSPEGTVDDILLGYRDGLLRSAAQKVLND